MIHARADYNFIQDPRGPVGDAIRTISDNVRRQVTEFRLGGGITEVLSIVDDFLAGKPCPGKIGQDEPVFLMRAQDNAFLPILRCAIEIYQAQGSNAVGNLERHVRLAEEWQGRHPTKVADLPSEVIVDDHGPLLSTETLRRAGGTADQLRVLGDLYTALQRANAVGVPVTVKKYGESVTIEDFCKAVEQAIVRSVC
jgi:hypothetical protein